MGLAALLLAGCHKAPAPGDTAAELDCADGADNDGDGLLDCEDSDCQALCVEGDCEDGLDDEGDGLTDCEDEDCWGSASCDRVISRVLGGQMFHRTRAMVTTWDPRDEPPNDGWGERSSTVALTSVYGSAEIWLADRSSWVTCGWSFSGGSFHRAVQSTFYKEGTHDSTSTASLVRTGLRLDSGCPLSTSAFLPAHLTIDGSGVLAGGLPRYGGLLSRYAYSADRHVHFGDSGVSSSFSVRSTHSWWTRPLDPGGTWSARLALP
jgi:hypothetical protein